MAAVPTAYRVTLTTNAGSTIDVTQDVETLSIQRNLATRENGLQAATCDVVIDNDDGSYSPYRPGTGRLLHPGMGILIEAEVGSWQSLFTGTIDRFQITPALASPRQVTVSGVDRVRSLIDRTIQTASYSGYQVSSAVTDLLIAGGVSSGSMDVDISPNALDVVTYGGRQVGGVLDEFLLYGYSLWMDRTGVVRMRDPAFELGATPVASYVDDFADLTFSISNERLINDVSVFSRTITPPSSLQVIAQLDEILTIQPGQSEGFFLPYDGGPDTRKIVGATEIQTPVTNADYLAWSSPDWETGSTGTNISSQVAVSYAAFAQTCVFTVTNNSDFVAYLYRTELRGRPRFEGSPISMTPKDLTSQQSYGVFPLRIETDLWSRRDQMQQIGEDVMALRSEPVPDISITQINKPGQALHDVGDVLRITETFMGLDDLYVVTGIQHDITVRSGLALQTSCQLLHSNDDQTLVLNSPERGYLGVNRLGYHDGSVDSAGLVFDYVHQDGVIFGPSDDIAGQDPVGPDDPDDPGNDLRADFSASPRSGPAPLTVVFQDLSEGTPSSFGWTFGDGESSGEQNPTHTYAATGEYDVTLTIGDGENTSSATKSAYVDVGGDTPPPAVQENRPYGGRGYGCGVGWEAVGNKQIRGSNIAAATYEFEVSGMVTKIRINNRINRLSQNEEGYGGGNCTAWVEVRPLTSLGFPDMSALLARTVEYTPATAGEHPLLDLQGSGFVIAPTAKIALVWRNSSNSTPEANYYSANFGLTQKPLLPRGTPAYPGGKVFQSSNLGTSFVEAKRGSDADSARGQYQFWGEFHLADGRVVGQPYRFANRGERLIDGSAHVRQVFRMDGSFDMQISGLSVRMVALDLTPNLTAQLYLLGAEDPLDVAPVVNLSSMTRFNPPSGYGIGDFIMGKPRGNPDDVTKDAINWFDMDFFAPVTLERAKTYELRLVATGGSKCWIWPVYNGVRNGGYQARESFGNHSSTRAQYSVDGSSYINAGVVNGSAPYCDWPIWFQAA